MLTAVAQAGLQQAIKEPWAVSAPPAFLSKVLFFWFLIELQGLTRKHPYGVSFNIAETRYIESINLVVWLNWDQVV